MSEILLGVIIALTQLAGYYYYYLSVKSGVRPNTTSWTIWTLGSILDLASYMALTGDWVKNLLPMACTFASVVMYVHFLSRGKFQKLSTENILMICADVFATIMWYVTDSALVGNLLLQVSTIISFVPIIKEVYDDDENETPLPWLIWSAAYFMDVILVGLRWEKWGDMVYPATCLVLHLLVWYLVTEHFKALKIKRRLAAINKKNGSTYEIEDHLYVSDSSIAGKGIFTSKDIKKGQVAFVLKGPLVHFAPRNKEEAINLPNIVGIEKDVYIDPVAPYVYFNHRCEPNLSADEDGVTYIALKDIAANEELTFDYSTSEHSPWEMECGCGSAKCRKVVKSIENLPPSYFAEYYPYIPPYFQKVYLKKYISENP